MVMSLSASDFINSVGINTRTPYTNTNYGFSQRVLDGLNYLGITNVRDIDVPVYPSSGQIALAYDKLANAGIKFDMQMARVTPGKPPLRPL